MADIKEVNGVYGGVDFGSNDGQNNGNGQGNGTDFAGNGGMWYGENGVWNNTADFGGYNGGYNDGNNGNGYTGTNLATGGQNQVQYQNQQTQTSKSNLPVKAGFWSKFKSIMFREIPWNYQIKVVLTPYQQKVEDEINEFLHQEITWEKVHDFLFQEISFGKKKRK